MISIKELKSLDINPDVIIADIISFIATKKIKKRFALVSFLIFGLCGCFIFMVKVVNK